MVVGEKKRWNTFQYKFNCTNLIIYNILTNKYFIVINNLISQLFVVTFIYYIYIYK